MVLGTHYQLPFGECNLMRNLSDDGIDGIDNLTDGIDNSSL